LRLGLCALLLAFANLALGQTYNFGELRWGISKQEATTALKKSGFTKISTDEDGDLKFEGGLLAGHKAGGFAFFTDAGLVKVEVMYLTRAKGPEVYGQLKRTLTEQYGPPAQSFDDQGKFSTFWSGTQTKQGLWIEVTQGLAVRVNYESAEWRAESERRKKAAKKK
jgi:hypothetical protein